MSAFDAYFGRVQANGTDLEIQGAINFVGSGFTVTPNPTQNRIDVALTAARATNRMVTLTNADEGDNAWDWSFTAHDANIRGYDHIFVNTVGFSNNTVLTLHADGAVENDTLSVHVITDETYFSIQYNGADIVPQQLGLMSCTYDFRFDGTDWIFWRYSELPVAAPPT